jgi:hypothetical protein
MRYLVCSSAVLLVFAAVPALAVGQNGTDTATTSVAANPATITVGGSVGITATVQPSVIKPGQLFVRPSGTITFLDGSTPLNATPLALSESPIASATFEQTFGTPNLIITDSIVQGELTGDLNGDGIPDLLIYGLGPDNANLSVQSFISDGKGGYSTGALQTLFPSGDSLVPVLVDLNDDGKMDILFGVQVAYGNGDGTFAQPTPVSFLSSGFVTAYAADLNGDGKTDILAVNVLPAQYPPSSNPVQWMVTVFLNQGGGSFTSAGTFPAAPPSAGDTVFGNFYPPAFIDLNGDGKLDLVTQYQYTPQLELPGSPAVAVLLNNGDGTFGIPMDVNVPGGSSPVLSGPLSPYFYYATGSGDLNGDGRQDLILAIADEAVVNAYILLGNDDGTFQSPTLLALSLSGGENPILVPDLTVQDANLDGKLDLVFGDGELALGNGDGTFAFGTPLFANPAPIYNFYPLLSINLAGDSVPSLVFLNAPSSSPEAAVFTPQSSNSATLSVSTLAVGAHKVSAQYSGDANYAPGTSPGVTVTVNQAISAIAVESSVNPAFAGQNVTLTAKVTSNGPMPTGNVTFTSGSTTLGTVPLSGGSAAYTTSFNTAGAQTIAASYSGDVNNQASSTTISLTVNPAFNLEPSGVVTITVVSGQAVNTTINVTGASGFSGQVSFACSGLPADAICAFNPATVAVSGPTVVPTSLTVNTAASTAAALIRQDMGNHPAEAACGVGLSSLILLWFVRRRSAVVRATLCCLLLLTTLGLTACGSSSSRGTHGTTPGTYNFTVTASSGSVQVTSAYKLVVQ